MRRNTFLSLLGLICLMSSGVLHADESCTGLKFSMNEQTPTQLRQIAAQCPSSSIADLYYHRAQYAELVRDNRVLQSLSIINTVSDSEKDAESYRMYIALVELMAEQMIPKQAERVAFLNQQYSQLNNLFELRMKGFDRIADRLEHEATFR